MNYIIRRNCPFDEFELPDEPRLQRVTVRHFRRRQATVTEAAVASIFRETLRIVQGMVSSWR